MSTRRIAAAVTTAALTMGVLAAPTPAAAPVAPVQATTLVMEALTPEPAHKAGRGASEASGSWYMGHQLWARTACLESTIAGFPLNRTAWLYNTTGLLKMTYSTVAGGCAKAGYPERQIIVYVAMTAKQKAATTNCAVTWTWRYDGYVTKTLVEVNLTGPQTTACGGGWEWLDMAAHETGHAVGFSHAQPSYTSVMRDGHGLDAPDKWRIGLTYDNNPEK